MDSNSKLRILVLGYVVRRPLGGGAWPTMQWALGLRELGHDVFFFEDSEDWGACYDPSRHMTDTDPTCGLAFATRVFDRLDFGERWTYYDAHTDTWHGGAADRARELAKTADVLINVSGINPIRPWLEEVPVRAYIDTDPGFEQIRLLEDEWRRNRAGQHNCFYTLGENIPDGRAHVPATAFEWQSVRQPVVLDLWPTTPGSTDARLTTVMNWDAYESREFDGVHFGMKSDAFRDYMDLPSRAPDESFEISLGNPGKSPKAELLENGWTLSPPLFTARDPWTYQKFIARSKAEFTIAKSGYARSRTGWFSERTAHYLASGRPAIVQETGFSDWLDADSGILPFTTIDEALSQIDALNRDYPAQCAAAREVAREYFDANRILTEFIESLGVTSGR